MYSLPGIGRLIVKCQYFVVTRPNTDAFRLVRPTRLAELLTQGQYWNVVWRGSRDGFSLGKERLPVLDQLKKKTDVPNTQTLRGGGWEKTSHFLFIILNLTSNNIHYL